jgi:hypothetical protein
MVDAFTRLCKIVISLNPQLRIVYASKGLFRADGRKKQIVIDNIFINTMYNQPICN